MKSQMCPILGDFLNGMKEASPWSVDEKVVLDHLSYMQSRVIKAGTNVVAAQAFCMGFYTCVLQVVHNVHSVREDLSRRNQLYCSAYVCLVLLCCSM